MTIRTERADLKLGGQKATTHQRGRECQVCEAKISIYNPNPTCWKHAKPKYPRSAGLLR